MTLQIPEHIILDPGDVVRIRGRLYRVEKKINRAPILRRIHELRKN